jgi:membrane-bound metal-dependent hydrolase YbcI (DUF457 family)
LGAAFLAAAVVRLSGMSEFSELATALVAASSTTMPDWIEIPLYRGGTTVGRLIPHRTITHWPPLWLLLISWGIHDASIIGAVVIGAAVGSLVHILGDAPNPMGIPWLLPHKRLRFGKKGWWRSGQHEFLMILSFATVGFLAWCLSGGAAAFGLTNMFI